MWCCEGCTEPAVPPRGLCRISIIPTCFGNGACATNGHWVPVTASWWTAVHSRRGYCAPSPLSPIACSRMQRLAATTSGVEATAVSTWRGCLSKVKSSRG